MAQDTEPVLAVDAFSMDGSCGAGICGSHTRELGFLTGRHQVMSRNLFHYRMNERRQHLLFCLFACDRSVSEPTQKVLEALHLARVVQSGRGTLFHHTRAPSKWHVFEWARDRAFINNNLPGAGGRQYYAMEMEIRRWFLSPIHHSCHGAWGGDTWQGEKIPHPDSDSDQHEKRRKGRI